MKIKAEELKPGQWFEHGGERRLCICSYDMLNVSAVKFAIKIGIVYYMSPSTEVELLEHCDGWEWVKPVEVKLEVGKRYVLRNGEITGPMNIDPNRTHIFSSNVNKAIRTWTSTGHWGIDTDKPSAFDIVSEYVESEKKWRPFTWQESRKLLGKKVIDVRSQSVALITAVNERNVYCMTSSVSYQDLLEWYSFYDGTDCLDNRCGVLE